MKRTVLLGFSILILGTGLIADEGMYLLNQIPFKAAKKAGLKMKAEDIYSVAKPSLSDAVVQIDGGSGTFLSNKGLVITNHHVGFQAIQELSTTETNFLSNGFYASNIKDELPAEGYSVKITLSIEDVTDRVLSGTTEKMDPVARFDITDKNIKAIIAETEKDTDLEAVVRSMYSGLNYYLFKIIEYRDVRLVYTPPQSVGEFGGDIDNWMWPRHTGDFCFFRVYCAPDGSPADYSINNVPYSPKYFVPVSAKGVRDGDYTMILGYPGHTNRLLTSDQVAFSVETVYPRQLTHFKMIIDKMEECGVNNPEVALKLASRLKSYNNVYKNNQGMLDGFKKLKLVEVKKAHDQRLKEFISKDAELTKTYGPVLEELSVLQNEFEADYLRNDLTNWLTFGPRLNSVATTIVRWALEQEKPDNERERGFMDRDAQDNEISIQMRMAAFYEPLDRWVMKSFIDEMINANFTEEPITQSILSAYPDIAPEKVTSQFVDSLYAHTVLSQPEKAAKLFGKSLDELKAINDPLINLALIIENEMDNYKERDKFLKGQRQELHPKYCDVLSIMDKGLAYPDANSTIRFTYGKVKGYSPQDAVWYSEKTSLKGVLAKYTGEYPFDSPKSLLKIKHSPANNYLWDKELKDFSVNFLHTTDITGGNSGSGVFNGQGQYIGIAFDGNYEAMTSDWQFDEALTRTISVDVRYILLVMQEVSHTQELLNELSIVR